MSPIDAAAGAVRRVDLLLVRRRWGAFGWALPALAVGLGLGGLAAPWAALAAMSPERRGGLGVRASLLIVGLTLLSGQAGFWRGRDRRVWTVLGAPAAALSALARWHTRRTMVWVVAVAVSAVVGWPARGDAAVWALWWITAVAWLPELAVLSVLSVAGPAGRPGGAPWLEPLRGSSPPESAGILVGNALPFVLFGLLSAGLAAALATVPPVAAAWGVLAVSMIAHVGVRAAWPRGAEAAYDVARALALSDLRDDMLAVSGDAGPAPGETWVGWGDRTPAGRFAWRRVWRQDRPAVLLGAGLALVAPWMAAGWERDVVCLIFPAVLGRAALADGAVAHPWWSRSLGPAAIGAPRLWWAIAAVPSLLASVGLVVGGSGWNAPAWVALGPVAQRLGAARLGPRAAWLGAVAAGLGGSVANALVSGGQG
jgi:hypothetical protein